MRTRTITEAATLIIVALAGLACVLAARSGQNITDSQHQSRPAATPDAGTPPAVAKGYISISPDLPTAVFLGTPPDMRVDNLEPARDKPRPPFPAPEGTVNVASGKPVTSSDNEPVIGELEMVTDGDKEAADGSFVELGPLKQHITIDLGDTYRIYAIIVWHFHGRPRAYFDTVCQVSADPDFVADVRTLFNNDTDNTLGLGVGKDQNYLDNFEGKLIDARGVKGRYVRLYGNGNSENDLNHYTEVEVYGIAAD